MSELDRSLMEHVRYPEHEKRRATALYKASHHGMVVDQDRPCRICSVRHSTLGDSAHNRWGATQMETHHCEVEDSLANAIDIDKFNIRMLPFLHAKFKDDRYLVPFTQDEMITWIHGDEHNLQVLCLTPEMPVLLADGSTSPIRDIRVGQRVVGHDGKDHRVMATACRLVDENLFVVDGVEMTWNHPVLTRDGWLIAGVLSPGEVVYHVRRGHEDVPAQTRARDRVFQPVIGADADVWDPFLAGESPAVSPYQRDMFENGTERIPLPDLSAYVAPIAQMWWGPIDHLHTLPYEGFVCDITVEGCSSFICNDLVVHNCDVHHRGKLVGIHEITGPIWKVQDLILDKLDLTGFHPYTTAESKAIAALPATIGKPARATGVPDADKHLSPNEI